MKDLFMPILPLIKVLRLLLPNLILSAILFICLIGFSTNLYGQKNSAKRVLVISLDGLDARYLHNRDKYGLRIPTLRRLLAQGVTSKGVRSVYPSLTYPNHTTLVTGALPAKHGIFGNIIFEPPVGEQTYAAHWFARDIRTDTLWDAASRVGMTSGMVSYPVAGGAGDWNIPEIWKPGKGLAEAREAFTEYARPRGLIEEIEAKFPDVSKNTNADEGDDERTRFAEYIITEKKPNVMLVHLFDLDHYQHDYGPFTPEAFAILEKVDGYVGRLLNALKQAGTFDETTVFITSDHGFKPITKQIHPGVLLRQAGLVEAVDEENSEGKTATKVTAWKAAVYVTGAACAIYLKDENDKASLKKLVATFKPLEGKNGVYKILEQKELKKIGSNTRAAIMIDAADGYTCGGNYSGDFITATNTRGMHGYLPSRPNFYGSFIAFGRGVEKRGTIDHIGMEDAGVTIAASLGVKLRDATGKVIELKTKR